MVPGIIPVAGGVPIGYPNPATEIEIGLLLKAPTLNLSETSELNQLLTSSPSQRKYKSLDELIELFGISPKSEIPKILNDYFKDFGVKFKVQSRITRTAIIVGQISSIENALNTKIATFQTVGNQQYLNFTQPVLIPSKEAITIKQVLGMTKPLKYENRIPTKPQDSISTLKNEGNSIGSLAEANNYPCDVTGKGQTIAVIELGGSYKKSDMKKFASDNKIKNPKIIEVGTPPTVTGTTLLLDNSEVTLDLEVLAALAPDAKLVVYYGHTIIEAMQSILSDTKNWSSVISISWAGSEDNYSSHDVEEMNNLFYMAALAGMTIISASGDSGAFNGKKYANVSLPASNPLVIGCGGTIPNVDKNNVMLSETVWNELEGKVASGGGFSRIYPCPTYQSIAVNKYPYSTKGRRGVPDVAGDASTTKGYKVVFNGKTTVIGGTSGATPFIAGLVALLNEKLGYNLGYINPFLYKFAGSDAYRQIIHGNNNIYPAYPYWNAATGLGAPNGEKLYELFKELEE